MHDIEPFPNWQHLYLAEEDEQSPFFGREHSEFEFSNTVYNYYIHPQWDGFNSNTLYMKILYADYEDGYCIMEFIGEWNDAVENDIMLLKRSVIDPMIEAGIIKFILILENVMNFHSGDESYYEEWREELNEKGGWIVFLNIPEHEKTEFQNAKIGQYCYFVDYLPWRTHKPEHFFEQIENELNR